MTEPAPVAPATPAATRNPTAMVLGVLGGGLLVASGFLSWISNIPDTEGTKAPLSLLWSPIDASTADVSFFGSAGFVVIIIGLVGLIGALIGKNGLILLGSVLGLVAYALLAINLMRTELLEIGFGDFGLGLWTMLAGGVLALAAGIMGRRPAA